MQWPRLTDSTKATITTTIIETQTSNRHLRTAMNAQAVVLEGVLVFNHAQVESQPQVVRHVGKLNNRNNIIMVIPITSPILTHTIRLTEC
jgi:hypothetical protein